MSHKPLRPIVVLTVAGLVSACAPLNPPTEPTPPAQPVQVTEETPWYRLVGAVTDEDGTPIPTARVYIGRSLGFNYVYSEADGHETNVQVIDAPIELSRRLRLRRLRTVAAGDRTTARVEADSSSCTDLEERWMLLRRCEVIRVRSTSPGRLKIEARSQRVGADMPYLFFATNGNYSGLQVSGNGVATVPITGGEYMVFIALPAGESASTFDVTTMIE